MTSSRAYRGRATDWSGFSIARMVPGRIRRSIGDERTDPGYRPPRSGRDGWPPIDYRPGRCPIALTRNGRRVSWSCSRVSAGSGLGLEPHGFETVWANQWEPSTRTQHAFDCYVRHFGDHPGHVCDDIEHALDEVEAGRAELPDHELLVGGFPCFAAGTMVLTESGHRPIEDVAVGDLVLTHRGRWRPVTAVMSRHADETVVLRGHGIPDIRTTAEHPFWARIRGRHWDNQLRRDVRAFGEPAWRPAITSMPRRTWPRYTQPNTSSPPWTSTRPSTSTGWSVDTSPMAGGRGPMARAVS